MIRRRVHAWSLTLGLMVGVGGTPGAQRNVPDVTMDRTRYSGRVEDGIVVRGTMRNRTTTTYYVGHCGEEIATTVQKLTNGRWLRQPLGWCANVRRPAAVLAPGRSLGFVVRFRAGPQTRPADITGRFNVAVEAYLSEDAAQMHSTKLRVPDSLRTSAPFEVVWKD